MVGSSNKPGVTGTRLAAGPQYRCREKSVPTRRSLLYDNRLLLDNAARRATGTTKQPASPGTASQSV